MTKHDDRKRRVRARMAKTGESYTTARARLAASGAASSQQHQDERREMSTPLAIAIDEAKRLAADSGAQQIAPIHLCAGLALASGSIAEQVMSSIGITAHDCVRRATVDADAGCPGGEVGVSVTSRAALEYARDELASDWDPALATGELGSGLVRVRDGRRIWVPRPPLRTGHLLHGLVKEGSVMSLIPRLGSPELPDSVRALLATDCELPPRWIAQRRLQRLPREVRELLAAVGADEVEEPTSGSTGYALYRDLATTLESLPPHRRAQPAIAVWYAAQLRVRRELDGTATQRLHGLTRAALEALLAAAIDDSPTVIRARRWHAASAAQD